MTFYLISKRTQLCLSTVGIPVRGTLPADPISDRISLLQSRLDRSSFLKATPRSLPPVTPTNPTKGDLLASRVFKQVFWKVSNSEIEKSEERIHPTYRIHSSEISGQWKQSKKELDLIKMTLESFAVDNDLISESLFNLKIMEVLSKGLAYVHIDDTPISLTIPVKSGKVVTLVPYNLKSQKLASECSALVLEPQITGQSHPLIVFQGTVPRKFGTVRASMGLEGSSNLFRDGYVGIGNPVLRKNKMVMADRIQKLKDKHDLKAILIGHSLGGALAQRFAIQEKNMQNIEKIVAFNAPGIPSQDYKKWEQEKKAGKYSDESALIFNTSQDPVNRIGPDGFIGLKVIASPTHNASLSKRDRHGLSIIGETSSTTVVKKTASVFNRILSSLFYPIHFVLSLVVFVLFFILIELILYPIYQLTTFFNQTTEEKQPLLSS